ncbi:GNAT family N-acetyltransferase [Thalassospira profundimaris]|uniref:Uncharacterized protein n=1 Tax=Thalassospira profundimaris TaxID=502049 RepID=A0A367WPT0_9PROT|nr:GNAT family N-acetyltransferase [Thalassospira profundimaris]RCK43209.1 hypothetical protein TH30_19520 [Thalassospira profundimaris]
MLHVNPREERFKASDGSLYESKLYIRYAVVSRNWYERPVPYKYFDAIYNAHQKSLAVVANVLFLDPDELRGYGIGSCLMNRIIDWAQEWPEAKVSPIDIFDPDPLTVARRKNFYEKFGLEFELIKGRPVMKHILVKDLKKSESGASNLIHDLPVGLMKICQTKDQLERDLAHKTREYDHLRDFRNVFTDKPFLTGLSYWFSKNLYRLMLYGLLLIIGASFWFSLT